MHFCFSKYQANIFQAKKLWETVKEREAWRAAVHGVTKSQTLTEQKVFPHLKSLKKLFEQKSADDIRRELQKQVKS